MNVNIHKIMSIHMNVTIIPPPILTTSSSIVKTATEVGVVGVRAIQDHKVIELNTCWKCRLSEGTDDM